MTVNWLKLRWKQEGDLGSTPLDNWHPIGEAGGATYDADYVDFSATNGVYYRKDPWGWVHFRGSAKRTASPAVNNEAVLTMPAGYRPIHALAAWIVPTGTTTRAPKLSIDSAGAMTINVLAGTDDAAAATRIYFDPICYRAEV